MLGPSKHDIVGAHKGDGGPIRDILDRKGLVPDRRVAVLDDAVEHVRAPKKIIDEASLRCLVHLGRCAHLLDAAARHDRNAVGEREGLFLIVRDENGG